MHRLFASTVPFYVRDLTILDFAILRGPGNNPLQILRMMGGQPTDHP